MRPLGHALDILAHIERSHPGDDRFQRVRRLRWAALLRPLDPDVSVELLALAHQITRGKAA